MINPLGFTLENFDAVGRFRERGEGQADRRDRGRTRRGPASVVKFDGARDLASFLAGSEETHAAFVEQLFHHLVKQPIRAFGPDTLAELRQLVRRQRVQHPQADGRDRRDRRPDARKCTRIHDTRPNADGSMPDRLRR